MATEPSTLGAEIENASTEMSVEPSPAAVKLPPPAPASPARIVRVNAASPALILNSCADFSASLSSIFLCHDPYKMSTQCSGQTTVHG